MLNLKINPSNPRTINKEKYEKLKNSIKGFIKMLEKRPIAYDEDGVIWGGNMRYMALSALAKDGLIEVKDSYFTKLEGYTLAEKKQFAILDNNPEGISGEWDFDVLANEWSDMPLEEWGIYTGEWKGDSDSAWGGMPDFGNKKSFDVFRTLFIHFDTQEDVDEFARLISQTITDKTKYIWFPFKEKEKVKLMSFKSKDES